MSCIFCQIIRKEIPAQVIYEDDQIIAFPDINPQAPFHQLIIPKKHIETLNHISEDDGSLLAHMITSAKNIAKQYGHADNGYRLNFNCNKDGGQTVFHIHLHLLAGRIFHWPPG